MKQQLSILLLLALIVVSALPFAAAETTLEASIQKYEPNPAQPGQYVDVYVELENSGNEDAPNAAIEIENQFPFSMVNKNEARKVIGVLKSQHSYVEVFRVRVDSEAAVGTNQLKILFTQDHTKGSWQETKQPIIIRPNDASLTITGVESSPREVAPGEDVTITLAIKNTADIVLRNIGVQLTLIETQGTTTITTVDYPFIPTGSSTEKSVTKLNPGELTQIPFTLKAYPQATPGYYKIPVTITFYDEEGTETTQEDYLGIIISASPELDIYFEETTLREDQNEGDVTLKFVNKGVNDLKFLEIELIETQGYEVLSSSRQYLGDLDSDDYRSETFTIKTTENNPELALRIAYKDENNQEYELQETIVLQYNKIPVQQKNNTGILVVIILVVALGIIVWRRKRHKRSS